MKILLAVDQHPYSAHAVGEVAQLAANTLANVGILGISSKSTELVKNPASEPTLPTPAGELPEVLFSLRRQFLSQFNIADCPYVQTEAPVALSEVKKGQFEALPYAEPAPKTLTVRMRTGSPAKEILAEAREQDCDLIVLGCDDSSGCGWGVAPDLPRKVATDAACSVLVVKQRKPIHRIMCCLDHNRISQPSLEMINQLVTLHKAQLTIVGLTGNTTLKADVEQKMESILRYYNARHIDPWIELVAIDALDAYIAQESGWGLMALWMGKQSILERALPRSKVNKLIKGGDASVLMLR